VINEKWAKTKVLTFSTEEAVAKTVRIVREHNQIPVLYLFGSRAEGRDRYTSDIDFAFWAENEFSWEDYYLLHGKVTVALRTDRINLVWMNKADPIIVFEVIANGKVVYCQDVDLLNDFELKAKKRYYDYQFYLQKHRNGL
jgi:predicted nucleotidyltransferase